MWRSPVSRTLLIAGGLLLCCVALVAWDYGLVVRERASTGAITDRDVPFVFGVDGDAGATFPDRRVDIWIDRSGIWPGFINLTVGPNLGRRPQRIVFHVQVPGVLVGAAPHADHPPDSFAKRVVPGAVIFDLGVTVPPQTGGKAVAASFALRNRATTQERLGVSSVRLARGSPAFGPRLGGLSEQDGVSPSPRALHPSCCCHSRTARILGARRNPRCPIFGSRAAVLDGASMCLL